METAIGTWTPPDQGARDLISHALDDTVFAVAGAGSGKTRHLVERVRAALTGGAATIDQVAVITFTEAAAAELRERLAIELEAAVGGDGAEQAARARHALDGLDAAAVTTLHGFARRVLAEHSFEAGLPPTFEVLDEAASLAALDECWPDTVDALLADEVRARAVGWILAAGGQLSAVRAIVGRLGENWDRVVPAERVEAAGLPFLSPGAVLEPLQRALSLAPWCNDPEDVLFVHLESLVPYAGALAEAGADELQCLRLLADAPPPISKRGRGRQESWSGRKQEVLELLGGAEDARTAIVSAAVHAALRVVGDGLGALSVDAAERRRREGRLQYHDLLVLACRLVRDHPDVRAVLHRRYARIFVDEFQDTDPLQAELVTMIAAEADAPVGEVEWWQLPTVPGALFFVGDPLQSIYAFRRADVATFLRTLDEVPSAVARLQTNFRSAAGIVEWVNVVFDALVGDGEPGLQPPFQRLVAVPAPAGTRARPAVSVLGAGEGGAGEPGEGAGEVGAAGTVGTRRAEEVRRAEAEQLAALVRRAVDEGWEVGSGGRPLGLDDIAVLVRARSSVPALERAFEAQRLAYRLESSSLVYCAPEVQELFQVLRAVDDPADAAWVVAALRSPGFGCGDDDLLRYRLAGGRWDYRIDPPSSVPEDDPVRAGMARLAQLQRRSRWEAVSELVARVATDLRQFEAALDGQRWREEWRRLRFVVDQARRFTESSDGNLREYLRWVGVQSQEDARVTEIVLPEADAPAVAVMTVHAAKGLEFPFVAVLGIGSRPQRVRAPAVLFTDHGPELALSATLRTAGFDAARALEARREEHEQLRLLYVAVTRAQRHLVVSVHRPSATTACTARQLEGALVAARAPDLWEPVPGDDGGPGDDGRQGDDGGAGDDGGFVRAVGPTAEVVARSERRGSTPTRDEDGAAVFADWQSTRAARLSARPRVVAATSVPKLAASRARDGAGGLGNDEEVDLTEDEHALEPEADGSSADEGASPLRVGSLWRRGRAATSVGRAVHGVLQLVDLATGRGLDQLARAHATREGIPDRWDEVAHLAGTALGSDVVRAAAQSRHWREIYVGAPFGRGVVEGFVDLLFEGAEGLEVVDYKTDRVVDEDDIAGLVERYRLQGAAYAAVVEAATRRPVVRCRFLFLRASEAVTREVRDLRGAIGEVRDLAGDPGMALPRRS